MGSFMEDDSSDLEEISELLGDVSGSTSTTRNSDPVTFAMLQLLKKQFEERYTERVANLRGELGGEKEERKENEKRLTKCIEKLMGEVLKMGNRIKVMEARIETFEGSLTEKAFNIRGECSQTETGNRNSGIDASSKNAASSSSSDVHPSDVEDNLNAPSFPISNVARMLISTGHSRNRLKSEGKPDTVSERSVSPDRTSDIVSPSTVSQVHESFETTESIHEKASTPGRFLQFLCVCGLEFDSETIISKHIGYGRTSKQIADKDKTTSKNSGNDECKKLKRVMSREKRRHRKDPFHSLTCICGRKCPTKSALYQHIRYHEMTKKFPCKSCTQRFHFAAQLRAHEQKLCRKGKPRGRKPKQFADQTETPNLLEVNESVQSTQDDIQDKTNSSKKGIISSGLPHHAKNISRPFHCICGLNCRNQLALYHHIRYYNKMKINMPFPFKLRALKTKPFNKWESKPGQHGVEKQCLDKNGILQTSCKCGRSFRSLRAVKRHIGWYHPEKQFTCPMCSQRFRFLAQMRSHMKLKHEVTYNTNDRSFACSVCTEMFDSMKDLRAHRRATHS